MTDNYFFSRAMECKGAGSKLVYRDKPLSDLSSGWREFSHCENGQYLANPNQINKLPTYVTPLIRTGTFNVNLAIGNCFDLKPQGRLLHVADALCDNKD